MPSQDAMMVLRTILLTSLLLIESVNAATKEIVLSTFDQSAPRIAASEMIVRALYRKLDIDLVIEWHPGSRALVLANSGNLDGVLVRTTVIEHSFDNLVRVPYPIAQIKYAAFAKRNRSINVDGWDSLKPFKIGIGRGIKLTEERTMGLDRLIVNSYKSLFKMLYLDRVDIVVFTELDGLYALKGMDLHHGIQKLDPILEVVPSYHFLHKKHHWLIKQLTDLMQKMDDSGELQALIHESELAVIESMP